MSGWSDLKSPVPTTAGEPAKQSRSKEDLFKKPEEITRGLKVALAGDEDVGKSYTALSFPPPIYVINTEPLGIIRIVHHFPGKDINIFDAFVIDPNTDQPDPIASIDAIDEAIRALRDLKEGTIVLDSATHLWQWVQSWLNEQQVKRTKSGTILQFEYAIAFDKYRAMVLRLLARPTHFVMTSQMRDVYDARGQSTGGREPRWFGETPHQVDCWWLMEKATTVLGQNQPSVIKYRATLQRERWQRMRKVYTVEDLTYEKIIKTLNEGLGIPLEILGVNNNGAGDSKDTNGDNSGVQEDSS